MGDPAENEDAVIIRMPEEDWHGRNGRSGGGEYNHQVYLIQSVGDLYLEHWLVIAEDGRIHIRPRIWKDGKFMPAEDSKWQAMTHGRRSGWPGRGR